MTGKETHDAEAEMMELREMALAGADTREETERRLEMLRRMLDREENEERRREMREAGNALFDRLEDL